MWIISDVWGGVKEQQNSECVHVSRS